MICEDLYIRDRLWKAYLARQPIMNRTPREIQMVKFERARRAAEKREQKKELRSPTE